MLLVGFIIRIHHDARSAERQISHWAHFVEICKPQRILSVFSTDLTD